MKVIGYVGGRRAFDARIDPTVFGRAKDPRDLVVFFVDDAVYGKAPIVAEARGDIRTP